MRPLKMVGRGLMRLTGGSEVMADVPPLEAEHVSVVTGSSSGIGLQTARGLAMAGGTVFLVGRNAERMDGALERIRYDAGHDRVHGMLADFASLDEVRRLGAALLARTERVDALVNNAGLWHHERRLSKDGIEESLAVNHLAPFLLTALLRGPLEASGGRVVNVSSRLHVTAPGVSIDDPAWANRPYGGIRAYSESKLANVLHAMALSRRLEGATASAVHPGDVATDVTRDSRLLSMGMSLVAPLLLTPWEGAQCSLHAAASQAASGRTGVYFAECAEVPPADLALDEALQERLWAWSCEATEVEW